MLKKAIFRTMSGLVDLSHGKYIVAFHGLAEKPGRGSEDAVHSEMFLGFSVLCGI